MEFKYWIYMYLIVSCGLTVVVSVVHPTEDAYINITSKEMTPAHTETTEYIIGWMIWPVTYNRPDEYILCLNDTRRLVVSVETYNNTTIGINKLKGSAKR